MKATTKQLIIHPIPLHEKFTTKVILKMFTRNWRYIQQPFRLLCVCNIKVNNEWLCRYIIINDYRNERYALLPYIDHHGIDRSKGLKEIKPLRVK